MNTTAYTGALRNALAKPIPWIAFGLYLAVVIYTMAHHELRYDEVNAWNIAKASPSFSDLVTNTRFEGHPPVWFTILWLITKCTQDLAYIQVVHILLAALVVFIVLFFAPFPLITRLLIPFGYYFLFEYAIFSRNYAPAVLAAFCLCLIIRKQFRYQALLYYGLLLLMTNVHLLVIPLAVGLHLYFLLLLMERQQKITTVALHALLGVLICIPALCFIAPPHDSQVNLFAALGKLAPQRLTSFAEAPIRSFIPVPAWWNYHFWNTQIFLDAQNEHRLLKPFNLLLSVIITMCAFYLLKGNRKCLVLFAATFLLSFIIALVVIPLNTERYAGFIFMGFMAAWWLYCYEASPSPPGNRLVNGLLIIQLAGGIFAVSKDICLPFSNLYRMNELVNEVPGNKKVVCDYWSLNAAKAYAHKPLYCIDLQKQASLILWDNNVDAMLKKPHRYYEGVRVFFQEEGIKETYLVSTATPQSLYEADSLFTQSYHVALVDKREGAIEAWSNLYLYSIKEKE